MKTTITVNNSGEMNEHKEESGIFLRSTTETMLPNRKSFHEKLIKHLQCLYSGNTLTHSNMSIELNTEQKHSNIK